MGIGTHYWTRRDVYFACHCYYYYYCMYIVIHISCAIAISAAAATEALVSLPFVLLYAHYYFKHTDSYQTVCAKPLLLCILYVNACDLNVHRACYKYMQWINTSMLYIKFYLFKRFLVFHLVFLLFSVKCQQNTNIRCLITKIFFAQSFVCARILKSYFLTIINK